MKAREIKELAERARKVCERCNLDPYSVELRRWELVLQGPYIPRAEETLYREGFKPHSSHTSEDGTLFLVFKKDDVRVVLVKEQ